MATVEGLLSGAANGKGVLVTGTTTGASVTVHTAAAGTSSFDEVWVWAENAHTAAVDLWIEWGEAAAPGTMKQSIAPGQGAFLIVPGWRLQNSLACKAYASVANVIGLFGHKATVT